MAKYCSVLIYDTKDNRGVFLFLRLLVSFAYFSREQFLYSKQHISMIVKNIIYIL